ncbi:MBL fold metallo-hydrolase [Novosphingobium sp. HII-3]|uniref:MBL fold metallo-hydrolase n=1 Tax=Novosphingobium sp. HII-3 TaxID=2075565 RepID=UPI001E3BA98E|nr:MBL fold metallo-hydrolase [Novosphingobium sp. HII-3]
MKDASLAADVSPHTHQGRDDRYNLIYPLKAHPEIGDGRSVEVAEGVHWLRMPMGKELGYINVWALADGDGWTVVDTGMRTEQTVEAWRMAFAETMQGRPVHRILVTHLHPDHSGMAGWIASRTGARLWMTRLEYLMLRVLANDTAREAPAEGIDFYRGAGWDEAALDRYRARFGEFGKLLYPIPNSFQRITDTQRIRIGKHVWQVVVGAGHSPEHACLHCPDLNLLISGDQVLPQISSNVSVHPLEPEADPLSDWLNSLAHIRTHIPDDVLVLPAHGDPFIGLHKRVEQLASRHEESLVLLAQALQKPHRAVDVFTTLFRRPITPELQGMATGESLAHLNCLRSRGIVRRDFDGENVAWWSREGVVTDA